MRLLRGFEDVSLIRFSLPLMSKLPPKFRNAELMRPAEVHERSEVMEAAVIG